MIRLTCTGDGANKFWEGATDGPTLIVRFGKVGTAGQEKRKALASAEAADAELAKLVSEKKKKGYQEDGPSAGAPPAVARAADTPPAAYPFRFYGRRPADWFEGAHALELRVLGDFAPAATVVARALGKRGLGDHAAVAVAPGFVRLDLTEPDRAKDPDGFFDAVDALLGAIHTVAPLQEVVLLSQRAPGSHPWDAWSRDAGPPSPGPVYADWKKPVAGEVRDASLPVPAPDASLTEAIRAARGAMAVAADERATARAVLAGGPAAVLARGVLQPKPPSAIVEAGGKGTGWRRQAGGGWIGVAAWVDDAARAKGEPWELTRVLAGNEVDGSTREVAKVRSWPGRWLLDGERLLMVARWGNYGSVVGIDLATGAATKLYEQGPHDGGTSIDALASVALGPAGELVCGSNDHLILVDSNGSDGHVVKADARDIGFAGSTLLAGKEKATLLYRVEKGKLRKTGEIKVPLMPSSAWHDGERHYVLGPKYEPYEIVGL